MLNLVTSEIITGSKIRANTLCITICSSKRCFFKTKKGKNFDTTVNFGRITVYQYRHPADGYVTGNVFSFFVYHFIGAWYNFNDSTVSMTSEDSIVHCKGYILFYTRQYPNVAVIESIKDKARASRT